MIDRADHHSDELDSMLEQVRHWEPHRRIALARRVLETLEPPHVSTPLRRIPLEQVFGLLKTEAPPPSDDECRQIIEEERLRKYG